MKTKPRGIWATFQTECAACQGELTVTNGREEWHDCHPISLAQLRAALGGRQ
ncbi:MAG: hypothetical protein M3536_02460 [Actinomycetota bacterium]|nr:hypothetical protein [Actinomycetota bacterium]